MARSEHALQRPGTVSLPAMIFVKAPEAPAQGLLSLNELAADRRGGRMMSDQGTCSKPAARAAIRSFRKDLAH
jgi:hypothetical protein